ncbi:Uncharacterised protein [Mycobacteroides abscessus subsp. abscessus]|nr:Uncharacterised protein [Mycobacteroides abscessus subsp. abscessus]
MIHKNNYCCFISYVADQAGGFSVELCQRVLSFAVDFTKAHCFNFLAELCF